ncbi:MAG: flavin reductase family protein [Planctomycetes bacterium]|nr:flavin reductase family protein [Planctomycetota bacterium]
MEEVSVSKAWNKKYPEQIGLAVTVDAEGTANVIALGWVMPTSGSPPMVAISIGHGRYSHELIQQCKEFVLAFPNEDQGREMLFCGTKSGRDVNKEKESGFEFVPAKKVKPPLLTGAVANLECRLVSQHETGDHTIFVGQILTAHIEEGKGRLYTLGGGAFGGVKPIEKMNIGE